MAIYDDLNSLDEWLLRQAIDQAEKGISIEDQLIPQTVALLGQPNVYLYATVMFDGEVGNGGIQQFFDNSSGALAPTVRDALQDMSLSEYADIMSRIIDAFGAVSCKSASSDESDRRRPRAADYSRRSRRSHRRLEQ